MKFDEAAERFLQSLTLRNQSARTISSDRTSLSQFGRFLRTKNKEDAPLSNFTPGDMDEYAQHLSERRNLVNGQRATDRHVGQRLLQLRRFFNYLVENRLLPVNPMRNFRATWGPIGAPKGVMTREEVMRIMAQPDTRTPVGIRNRAILEVLYGCGLRRMEITALDVSNVNLEMGFVTVIAGKGAKDRVVPIADQVVEWLYRYLDEVRPDFEALNPGARALWLSVAGERMCSGSFELLIKQSKKMAGVKKPGTMHVFRHSIATHLLDAGLDLRYIQTFLGHEHIQSTERYAMVAIVGLDARLRELHPRIHMNLPAARYTGPRAEATE